MQAVRNGIKCTFRTPGKAALFALILTVLTALTAVSFMSFFAVSGYIRDANEYYHTIAELEFVGEDYPDRNVYDTAAAEAVERNAEAIDALVNSRSVISYEPNESYLGLVDGLRRNDDYVFNSKSAVLGVYIFSVDPNAKNSCVAVVTRCYYSFKNMEDKIISLRLSDPDAQLEKGKRYVMSGYYFTGASAQTAFLQQSFAFEDAEGAAETPAFEETEDFDLPDSDLLMRFARVLNIQNNSCRVTYTNSLPDLVPFHQQVMKLKEGRLFTEEEYSSSAKVCVLSDKITGVLGLKTGDKIKMSVFGSDGDLYNVSTLYGVDSGEYEIVGVFTDVDDYPCWIFLPGLRAKGIRPSAGYTTATFLLKNEGASAFIREAGSLDNTGFRISVYDQGYSAAVDPLRELLLISVIFLAVCLLLAAAALMLQSWVFVSRQRDAAVTMYKLGSGKAHIIVYFLSAALIITVIAAVVGCFAGRLIESRVVEVMQRFAGQHADQDMRFSFADIGSVRRLEFSPQISLWVYAFAAGVLIAGSALFTLGFSISALRGEKTRRQKPKKKKKTHIRGAKTSRLGGVLKYAFISIRRSRVRTFAVLLIAALAAVFFARLDSSLDGYREQLDAYRSSASISGFACDYYGRRIDRLSVKSDPISALIDMGTIEEYSVSKHYGHCTLIGVAITRDGEEIDIVPELPETQFERESLFLSISRDRPWVGVSSIENNPQTYYSRPQVTWLEGYGMRDFFSQGLFCALSEKTMNENGIELGDCVLFEVIGTDFGSTNVRFIIMKVIASYSSASTSKTVFSPLRPQNPTWGDPYGNYHYWETVYDEWLQNGNRNMSPEEFLYLKLNAFPDKEIVTQGAGYTTYSPVVNLSSFLFRINDPSKLDELRDQLIEAGYTYVGSGERLKNFAVIYDEVYLNTVHSMERQIQYVSALYYSLYVIVFIIGAALAWLLCVSRRQEIALMRALGTQKWRIILNFFVEQVILSAIGVGAGLLIGLAVGGVTRSVLLLSAAFLGVWTASAFICLVVSLMKRARAALTEPE